MSKAIIKKLDPLKASYRYLLCIAFAETNSPSYSLALGIAQHAAHYEEGTIGKKRLHFAGFAKTREDVGRARSLIQYIAGWKSFQIFAGGKLIQNIWQVNEVLECFLEASGCDDWRAHCHKIIDDPFIEKQEERGISVSLTLVEKPPLKKAIEIDRYVFPCSLLHHRFRFQTDHPSTPQDQIQAAAVATGCDWCPNFKPPEYKKIGTRKVIENLFD